MGENAFREQGRKADRNIWKIPAVIMMVLCLG